MDLTLQTPEIVAKSYNRIKQYIHKTPILYSDTLNIMLGNNVYFKMDALQKTGAFKVRGVLNHLLALKEIGQIPQKIVAYSTGNHALAMAYAAKLFNIHARVYLPENVSPIKKRIANYYGAEVIEVLTRGEAEKLSKSDESRGFYYMHPSDSDETIAGAGTMCYEALLYMHEHDIPKPDAIFAPCGGGGLLSGTYLAKELLSPTTQLIGVEPKNAADAFNSIQTNKIYKFTKSPDTIADGLRALSISKRTLSYLKKLDDFYLVEEEDIYYWTAWLIQMMKVTCEPSSAICIAAAVEWLKKNNPGKNILILVSGGNIDPSFYTDLWENDSLEKIPKVR